MSYFALLLKPRSLMLLLVLAVGIAYSNSFFGPFIYDDLESIPHNLSLRSLIKGISQIAYGSETVTGRPILNFSLALNYALGGLNPFGFHLVNFLVHLLNIIKLQ